MYNQHFWVLILRLKRKKNYKPKIFVSKLLHTFVFLSTFDSVKFKYFLLAYFFFQFSWTWLSKYTRKDMSDTIKDISNRLYFQIILGHKNLEPRVTQLHVQITQVLSAFRRARCRCTLDTWLETVLRTSRCPVLVTASGYAVTAFRCHVRVRNLFEVIIICTDLFSSCILFIWKSDSIFHFGPRTTKTSVEVCWKGRKNQNNTLRVRVQSSNLSWALRQIFCLFVCLASLFNLFPHLHKQTFFQESPSWG